MTPYAPGFPRSLRKQIIARDGAECIHCGARAPLHVHHMDGSKINHDPTNLVTLCASCHRKVHPGRVNEDWMNRYGSSLFAAARRPITSTTCALAPITTTTRPAS
ncbi:MAG: HNH endonuclease [Cyanobacteria bacterium REEB65]|nr:HNH endonuclease [Cyanobacteria bacterium REEB65]